MVDALTRPKLRPLVLALVTLGLAVGPAACGSDDDKDQQPGAGKQAEKVEKAFLSGMLHHHESAISMATIARERGKDPYINKLGLAIVTTQEREMDQMDAIYKRLYKSGLKPDPKAHDGLGLSAGEAGMTHSERTNESLRKANPFDRAFVDQMIPHHRGAVRMSQVVLRTSTDKELRKLAEGIIATQTREIDEMNAFRAKKFGSKLPSEIPPAGAEHGDH